MKPLTSAADVTSTAPSTENEVTKTSSQRWKKATKQVATLGPASSTFEMIEKLFLAGADVFRLNFSHGKHSEKQELVDIIRAVEEKWNHPIAILADLQGPKLRVGIFDDDKVELVEGQKFRFDMSDEPGDACRVQLPHPEILTVLNPGDILLLDDGKLRMEVEGTDEDGVDTKVIVGGSLSNKKGVNVPTVALPISPLTEKDRADLEFALEAGVCWVALSFVQKPEDIVELRELVGDKAKIMAKLEKPQAIDKLEEIVELCDAIMVARGDLGVEMMPEDVPIIQKKIINTCRRLGRPCVVATQMLESMITSPTPTRAECSDVATAVFDGADAVMLSAESAAGKYPIESVEMQQRVINRVESNPSYRFAVKMANKEFALQKTQKSTATDAMTLAAKQIARTVGAKAIVAFTSTGSTCVAASKLRPSVPIIGVSPNMQTGRYLSLAWGVYPTCIEADSGEQGQTLKNMMAKACNVAVQKKIAEDPNDQLVITAGLPFGVPGIANVIRVIPASGPDAWEPVTDLGDKAPKFDSDPEY
eukprot:CAMPEP_0113943328 /NCGR_PEP_ID=MMETSP1339-20121228/23188_1 /TAXON_ID=94617 /ORGANISM="Fibrocapsa japonica" /LENGTH=533 /DNA_ID=CAMNT_0000948171 /DNA_START=256 /DNA_END=1857 /DNA_ORIENTATION=- /assembly_acc=CAM_ASM_000762